MIAAVIFDLDGVLVDSETISCGATADLLVARGIAIDEPEVRRRFLGRPIAAVYDHVAEITGRPLDARFAAEKEDLYFERARGTLRAFPGAHATVEAVAARFPIAIASSGSPRKVAFSLAETGLGALFSVVCTTAEVARGKPAPDLFELAAARLGVDPRTCVVIEDSVPGIVAARAAGMHAIGITTSVDRDALSRAGAHDVVDRIDQILALLP